MTHATLYKSSLNGEILGFRVEGHAGYANAGSDIVCASISILVINTINTIDLYCGCKFTTDVDEKAGLIEFKLNPFEKDLKVSNEVRVLLNGLELGLCQVAKENPKSLTITVEEV
jgi:uncharacterized protein YsxB (DUF464 family)